MVANSVISLSDYKARLESGEYVELENLTLTKNLQSDTYTYYRVECKSKLTGRFSQHIVAVFN